MSTIAELTERALIARITAQLPASPSWLRVGPGDDAAVVEHERNHFDVITVDALVDGVHFDRAFTPPASIGHRALAVNLSDLAAMGARPRLALLSMALPPALPLADFDGIVTAFAALAKQHQLHLAGGNLTRTPGPLTLDVTAIGVARRKQVLTRGGARPGDELFVTGEVGSARAGLQALQSGADVGTVGLQEAVHRYLYPDPRVRTALLVARNRAASACMDLSDGLADAVSQLTEQSGVGATLSADSFPLAAPVRAWFESRNQDPVQQALDGGDDYELLFAVPRRSRRAFFAATRLSGIAVTRIGVCTPETGVRLDGQTELMTSAGGFRHFR